MVMYYYDKHNIIKELSSWSSEKNDYNYSRVTFREGMKHATSYRWTGGGYVGENLTTKPNVGSKIWVTINTHLECQATCYIVESISNEGAVSGKREVKKYRTRVENQKKGTFIETIKAEDGEYPNDGKKGSYWYVKKGVVNTAPTITVTAPSDGMPLTHGSKLTIKGTSTDKDIGDAVTIKYSITSERVIDSYVSSGSAKSFTKDLVYKDGNMYDGNLVVASNLTDGTHTIKIWAEDNSNTKSEIISRRFTTTKNRPPTVKLKPIAKQEGLLQNSSFRLAFTVSDLDGDKTLKSVVTINNKTVHTHNVPVDKEYTTFIPVSELTKGINTLVVTVTDSNGATDKATMKITNDEVAHIAPKQVMRYDLEPNKDIDSVIMWIKHKKGNNVDVDYSTDDMEVYEPFDKTEGTSPTGIQESEFYKAFDKPMKKVRIKVKDAENATMIMGGMSAT